MEEKFYEYSKRDNSKEKFNTWLYTGPDYKGRAWCASYCRIAGTDWSKQTGTSGTTGKTINIPLIEPSIIKPITETNATKISGSSEFPVNSVFTLRRASSKNNFNYWETLYEIKIAETPITELVFKDYTV